MKWLAELLLYNGGRSEERGWCSKFVWQVCRSGRWKKATSEHTMPFLSPLGWSISHERKEWRPHLTSPQGREVGIAEATTRWGTYGGWRERHAARGTIAPTSGEITKTKNVNVN